MIQIEGLWKSYSSGRGRIQALSNVSFSVDAGRTLTVVGKSGSGKTTLLNCAGGLEQPDKGIVTCFGANINSLSGRDLCLFQRKNMGFVFQFGNLLNYLTVIENISFPLALNGIEGVERKRRVMELLERVELADAGPAMPSELSGGEVQRVSFARAVAHFPKILLADEPTASLDSSTGLNLVKLMFETGKEQGCTIIISTHDREIIKLSDHILYLQDGKNTGEPK
ncbi:MAG: ABC transporter ATP-binding protein [Deltaproteobacteria bacterium]|nr:ABC transporter ATP-binding protein [Deltaproteobacteria bacterium]